MANLILHDDYQEPNRFTFGLVPDEDDLETPILRVFVMFKILLINLIFGCLFTIFCLSVKQSVGHCLSVLFCGFCDQCDCDYDGSHVSRSREKTRRYHRRGVRVNRAHNGFKETVAYTFWLMCKNFFGNKKLVRKVFFGLVGIIAGYSVTFGRVDSLENGRIIAAIPTPTTPIYSLSNDKVLSKEASGPRRVYFVMPTMASGIQIARLTRVAQALYPNRDFVTWVIVSADPVQKYVWQTMRFEHWGGAQLTRWKQNEEMIMDHLGHLHETVSRFGVPFVILSGHDIHHDNKEYKPAQMRMRNLSTFIKAVYVGLSWVTKTFKDGVLVVGVDDGAYNYNLFREARETKVMSSWPVAFDPRYRVYLSTPFRNESTNKIGGYFSGGSVNKLGIPLQYGGYAINMKVVRKIFRASDLWKLTFDGVYSSNDVNLKIKDIEMLAKNCSEVYFWKMTTTFSHAREVNRQRIPLKVKWIGTNVEQLHKFINKWFAINLNRSYL